MRRIIYQLAIALFPLIANAQEDTLKQWFNNMEWFNSGSAPSEITYDPFGRAVESDAPPIVNTNLKPDSSVNVVEFAKQYKANPERWNRAFDYLKNTDFSTLAPGRYQVGGDDVFAVITLGPGKSADTVMWESHRNYEDIHYVISGVEQIGIAPLSNSTPIGEYNSARDLAHHSAKGKFYTASPGTFFIITTMEAHKPGIRNESHTGDIKKLYIKVKKSQEAY